MAFNKHGLPSTGIPGRPKGYSPKRCKQNLKQVLERRNVNLIDAILDDLPNLRPDDRVDVLMRLVEYTTPKLRAVEVVGMPQAGPTTLQVNIANVQAPERSAFRAMLENPDTLAAVRKLDATMDALPAPAESIEGEILDEAEDPSLNGSHPGVSDSFEQSTNDPTSTDQPLQKIIKIPGE